MPAHSRVLGAPGARSRSAASRAKSTTMAWRSGFARPPTQWSGDSHPCAEDIRPGGHPLPELFREGGQRRLIDAERPQTVPGEGHGHPPLDVRPKPLCRPTVPSRGYAVSQASAPRAAKSQEFVTCRERRRACNQEMLDVVKLSSTSIAPVDYCIWSSILEKAALSFNAFLISSALTYGYSPYSRKLGTGDRERTR